MKGFPPVLLLLAALAGAPQAADGAGAPSAGAAPPAPLGPAAGSPFGPPWDPARPAPAEPVTAGAGITSAKLLVCGAASVEEHVAAADGAGWFGVAVEVEVAAASTTPALDAKSAFVESDGGPERAVVVACTPTLEDASAIRHTAGASIAAWNIAIADQAWFCGGRTARLATRVGSGGFRLRTRPDSAWSGPLVLLFEHREDDRPQRLILPGASVDLGGSCAPDPAN